MTMHDDLETRLFRAFDVAPTADGLGWLDQRMSQVLARGVPATKRSRVAMRRILRPLIFIAAFILLTTAVAAGLGLLDRTIDSSGAPGWHVAWDRAEVLDLSQTDAGVTITVERAYADLNQVLVGFTVEGLAPPPAAPGERVAPIQWTAELRDPSGRPASAWATSTLARTGDETGLAAVIQTWTGKPSPLAGAWELTVTSVGYGGGDGMVPGACTVGSTDPACSAPVPGTRVDGTWVFTFDMPQPAGTVVTPEVHATQNGATITLTELRITPTMITSTLALTVADTTVTSWGSDSRLTAPGGATFSANGATHLTQDPERQGPLGDEVLLEVLTGSDVVAGTWVLEIPELDYVTGPDGPGRATTLTGPWTLTVTIP